MFAITLFLISSFTDMGFVIFVLEECINLILSELTLNKSLYKPSNIQWSRTHHHQSFSMRFNCTLHLADNNLCIFLSAWNQTTSLATQSLYYLPNVPAGVRKVGGNPFAVFSITAAGESARETEFTFRTLPGRLKQ